MRQTTPEEMYKLLTTYPKKRHKPIEPIYYMGKKMYEEWSNVMKDLYDKTTNSK